MANEERAGSHNVYANRQVSVIESSFLNTIRTEIVKINMRVLKLMILRDLPLFVTLRIQ